MSELIPPQIEIGRMRTHRMPQAQDMMRRLDASDLFFTASQSSFNFRLIESTEQTRQDGIGLYMNCEFVAKTFRGMQPNQLDFERTIDAISPHPNVAYEAKIARQRSLEINQHSLDDLAQFETTRKIATAILQRMRVDFDEKTTADLTDPNPSKNQTAQGVFLQLTPRGAPSRLWTPWGAYPLAGTTAYTDSESEEIVGEIVERSGATLYRNGVYVPDIVTIGGQDEKTKQPIATIIDRGDKKIGKVYALHHFDGVELPSPEERHPEAFVPEIHALDAWRSNIEHSQLENEDAA